ncbi:hypothetical protein EZV62_024184 [Acer yangbiense]|uniref:Ubiquitin-like protease family profile domain-containing protein n=1 Tax=Acer yangbiense TaxID=1000413 RepID=A0A5C7H3T7_9ROSI|nr:hypothetical protein EZV62_024184 [Acer yangbiense]
MVNSIRKRRKITGQQTTRDEGGTQSTIHVGPKLDRMSWIHFHRQERQMKTAEGSKKSMKEVRDAWNTLSMDEKSKYKMPKEDIVDDKGHLEEAADDDLQVRELGFSNLFMLNCGRLRRDLCGWLVSKFDTSNLSIELHGKRFTLDPLVFSHIIGISDGGDSVVLDGDVNHVWRSKYSITNRGIRLPQLEEQLKNIKTTDDDFKITFCLYLFGTILAPTAGEYVDERYLNILGDVQNIRGKNWARWCFNQLVAGIQKFNSKSSKYITGCLLFLQLFYFHVIDWQPTIIDKNSVPVVLINDYVPPAASIEHVHKAEHNRPNDDMLTLVLQEIQSFRKEIQLFRTEHTDLIEKVKREKVKVDVVPPKEQLTPKPTPFSDDHHGPVTKDFSFKFDDAHAPEHTSIPSLLDEEKRKTIVKTLAEQSSTSINVVKNTRASSKRKPSRYQVSPYESEYRTGKATKHRYGPFRIPCPLKTLDAQIIKYVFCTYLPMSETIVDTNRIIVSRKSFRTLAPTEWVDSEIISLVADNNARTAKRKRASLYWYLPTQFAIYIPINNLKNHWYTALVKIKDRKVEIWDSLPSRRKNDQSRVTQVRRLMISLDYVLETEIHSVFGSSFSFASFSIESPVGPTQPNEFDCGVFVCMFLNDLIGPWLMTLKSFQLQRLLLARQLATYPTNTHLEQLKQSAIEHVALDTIGNKRSRPPLKLSKREKAVKTLS